MKYMFGSNPRCNENTSASYNAENGFLHNAAVICGIFLLVGFVFTGCKKEMNDTPVSEPVSQTTKAVNTGGDVINNYTGLSPQTLWQLEQARAASAKYLDFNNAIKDGYADINVVTPQMGYHYLKAEQLDLEFDCRKPEILIYNKTEEGEMRLVAVEYAVPIDLTPNTAPQGFIGTADVWDRNTFFGLWLLHTWVWAYNPYGVFNPTNPLIHLH
ncbi:MAG TPA: hypothetical protein VFO70_04155 [Chitinophagaceae bacterium]|nr:hypothetical protein [Chitinophagaceae bacterium]